VDHSTKGENVSKKVIAQRVYFRLPNEGQRSRVFMDCQQHSAWEWRAGVAWLELSDLKRWREVKLIGVRPIYAED
jgi:hypothetical protein